MALGMRFSGGHMPMGPSVFGYSVATKIVLTLRLMVSIISDLVSPFLLTHHDFVVYYFVFLAYYCSNY